jgi:hypothetical protein
VASTHSQKSWDLERGEMERERKGGREGREKRIRRK